MFSPSSISIIIEKYKINIKINESSTVHQARVYKLRCNRGVLTNNAENYSKLSTRFLVIKKKLLGLHVVYSFIRTFEQTGNIRVCFITPMQCVSTLNHISAETFF